ncbi:hypothetical protein ACHQM5_017172 [Ranunculus cassubicifolius]
MGGGKMFSGVLLGDRSERANNQQPCRLCGSGDHWPMKCPNPGYVDCPTVGCPGVMEIITFYDEDGKINKFLQCILKCPTVEWLYDDPTACYRCGEDHDIMDCPIEEIKNDN